MVVVPWPDTIVAPAGGVQLYDVAPDTALMLKVRESPGQTLAIPPPTVMVPGVLGVVHGLVHAVRQAALLIVLTIAEVGCGPNPLLKLIPTPLTKWQ